MKFIGAGDITVAATTQLNYHGILFFTRRIVRTQKSIKEFYYSAVSYLNDAFAHAESPDTFSAFEK